MADNESDAPPEMVENTVKSKSPSTLVYGNLTVRTASVKKSAKSPSGINNKMNRIRKELGESWEDGSVQAFLMYRKPTEKGNWSNNFWFSGPDAEKYEKSSDWNDGHAGGMLAQFQSLMDGWNTKSADAVHVPKKKLNHSSGVPVEEVNDNNDPNTVEITEAAAMAVEKAVVRVNQKKRKEIAAGEKVDWSKIPRSKRGTILKKRYGKKSVSNMERDRVEEPLHDIVNREEPEVETLDSESDATSNVSIHDAYPQLFSPSSLKISQKSRSGSFDVTPSKINSLPDPSRTFVEPSPLEVAPLDTPIIHGKRRLFPLSDNHHQSAEDYLQSDHSFSQVSAIELLTDLHTPPPSRMEIFDDTQMNAETAPFPAPSSIAPVASVAVAGCSSDSYVRKPLEREVLFPAQKETKDLPVKPKPKADLAQNPARNVVADCTLCLPVDQPWVFKDGVTNYPRKSKKTAAKVARNIVLIVERSKGAVKEYLLWQRPSTGLLANLWEFPSTAASERNSGDVDGGDESSEISYAVDQSKVLLPGQAIERFQRVADVFHQFSHISQTYAVYCCAVGGACDDSQQVIIPKGYQAHRWLAPTQIASTAISTAMKKVFGAFSQNLSATSESSPSSSSSSSLKRKASSKSKHTGTASKRKQTTMQSFFKEAGLSE